MAMWGKEEKPMPPARETPQPVYTPPAPAERSADTSREVPARGGIATIRKSLSIKGQISGTEDLYIDGEVEGTAELKDHNINVGTDRRGNANLHSHDLIVLRRV